MFNSLAFRVVESKFQGVGSRFRVVFQGLGVTVPHLGFRALGFREYGLLMIGVESLRYRV